MFFKRKQPVDPKVNIETRKVFIFTGSQADIVDFQNTLDKHNLCYSNVRAYYEMELVPNNIVILHDRKAITYLQEYGDCYLALDLYVVLPKGKQLSQNIVLEENIKLMNYSSELINNVVKLDVS